MELLNRCKLLAGLMEVQLTRKLEAIKEQNTLIASGISQGDQRFLKAKDQERLANATYDRYSHLFNVLWEQSI